MAPTTTTTAAAAVATKKVKVSKPDPSLRQKIGSFQIVGRACPTESNQTPKIYRMKIFAKNVVLAKSKFWYYMNRINKVKKSVGEILDAVELRTNASARRVLNYGLWIRYDSRTGTHNMYKEYRDVSETGAVSQLHAEMAGNHRALSSCIQIIRIQAVPDAECRRARTLQLHKPSLKFPVVRRLPLDPHKYRSTFKAARPTTFVL
eukprot:GHVS01049922.1.p1 GENE.GHVS01049922.1~~GHVS01049922.1.p1  ORF type:complete len:205 (-),score=21.46 GHVS01049922.1:423-1037(-)